MTSGFAANSAALLLLAALLAGLLAGWLNRLGRDRGSMIAGSVSFLCVGVAASLTVAIFATADPGL